ncbi:hypothetical protein [Leucobacter sp. wl10]|uniref:hypothetical protein n=1 Tax=Leucobacter sp. wl10 TaxID=2304677 RepID=UPI000E5A90EC|nr:hypothetical protein [Leucobacter sp. wl10]RGE20290.1 hypothetical protein D1J51_08865 [Leucobacter sp. wl10]
MTGDRHLRVVGETGEDPWGGPEAMQPGLTEHQQRDLARARRAALWAGLILPISLVATSSLLLILWLPRLPDPLATHWSGAAGPDGFGPPWLNVVANAGIGVGMALMFWLIVHFGSRPSAGARLSGGRALPAWSAWQRAVAAMGCGTVLFTCFMFVATTWIQLDLDDARDAPGVTGLMGIGFLLWILVAVAAFLVQPKVRIDRPGGGDAAPLALERTERAVWVGEVRPSGVFIWVMGGAIVFIGAITALTFLDPSAPPFARWVMIGSTTLLIVLGATSLWYRVRVDDAGIEARSILGWPRFRVPVSDIDRVAAGQINPLSDFGGWGWRWSPGRFGIVMRTGEGILVTRRNGGVWAVTVDGAQEGAALLAAVADRTREGGGRPTGGERATGA